MNIRFGIRNRLLFLIAVMLVFMGIVVAFFVYQASQTKTEMIQKVGQIMAEDARDKIMVATRNMATAIGAAITGVEGQDERVAVIRKLISDIRFEADDSGYFFVYKGTVNVILPPNAKIEGKDLADAKDVGGILFVRELQKQAQAGGGFVDYVFAKPGKGDQPKVSYATMIPGTDMWIGTGVYVDNIAEAQAKVAAELEADAARALTIALSFIGAGFALLILPLAIFLVRSIITPLNRMMERKIGRAHV